MNAASRGGSGFESLARGIYLEALLVDGEDVWYSDVSEGGIRKLGSDRVWLAERTLVGGLLMNADGSLLVSGEGGIVWFHPERGTSGALLEGLVGVNEMRADGRGGLYFGTIDHPAIRRGDKPGPSALYHLARDRTLRCLAEGLVFSNGLAPSADGSLLFHNESFVGSYVYPVGADGGLGERRSLFEKPDCDGLALDAGGDVWLSGFSSGELLCLTPTGKEVRRLELPGAACTNVRFGGSDGRDLYVCLVTREAAEAIKAGERPERRTSELLKGRSPVPGAPLERADFAL